MTKLSGTFLISANNIVGTVHEWIALLQIFRLGRDLICFNYAWVNLCTVNVQSGWGSNCVTITNLTLCPAL